MGGDSFYILIDTHDYVFEKLKKEKMQVRKEAF